MFNDFLKSPRSRHKNEESNEMISSHLSIKAFTQSGGFRTDIQGLRAIAVGLVVIFHMFPLLMPGGYVGVDVFFVISGYLISGLLIRAAERDGGIDFKDFYIRRARRLLPAACVVLTATGLACLLILPRTLLQGVGREILASAFYFENFYLYFQGRDYLTADTAASPFQHYWSLSIEEQFYIVWPIVIAIGIWASKRLKINMRYLLLIMLSITALVSLYFSAVISPKNPGAYFLTSTRVWELALGGMLALGQPFVRLTQRLTLPLRWIGLAAILFAGITFTKNTVFPGTAALIPTLGAIALLLPRTAHSMDPGVFLSFRPMTYLGDISYSLYLWHWPILVLGAYLIGDKWSPWESGVAFSIMIATSHLSKYYIEDKFRHLGDLPRSGQRTLGLSVLFLTGSTAVAAILIFPSSQISSETVLVDRGDYLGAYALSPNAATLPLREFTPAVSWAVSDNPDIYSDNCQLSRESSEPKPCIYGNADAPITIALVGDSHAAQYLPALQAFATKFDVRIITQTKSDCPFLNAMTLSQTGPYTACANWNAAVMEDILTLKPNVVVTAKFSSTFLVNIPKGSKNDEAVADALAQHWTQLGRAGIPVVAIANTPVFPTSVPDCISTPGKTVDDCSLDRNTALSKFDHIHAAGQLYPQAIIADMNDYICEVDSCPAVVGNVLVYRDAHHLTATYASTLDTALGEFVQQAVDSEIDVVNSGAVLSPLQVSLSNDLLDLVPDREIYPGALAMIASSSESLPTQAVRPSFNRLSRDYHSVFANGCYAGGSGVELISCELGADEGRHHIIIIGDNAAAQWLPALELYVDLRNIRVTTLLKSGCPLTAVAPLSKNAPNLDCVVWGENAVNMINRIQPDIVLTAVYPTNIAAYHNPGESGKAALSRGISMRLSQIQTVKTQVVTLSQLPIHRKSMIECLKESKGDAEIWVASEQDLQVCGTPRTEAMRRVDIMKSVASELPNVDYLNFTEWFCSQTTCPALRGGILTFKDQGHVTTSYMRTLAPILGANLDEKLGIVTP